MYRIKLSCEISNRVLLRSVWSRHSEWGRTWTRNQTLMRKLYLYVITLMWAGKGKFNINQNVQLHTLIFPGLPEQGIKQLNSYWWTLGGFSRSQFWIFTTRYGLHPYRFQIFSENWISTFNHNFFWHFTFQLWIYLSLRKLSKLQTIISNWYIKVILTFLLRTKNNSVEGWRNCSKGIQIFLLLYSYVKVGSVIWHFPYP